ncbi:restriction endonuclease subunit S [Bartonella sp. HY406]|uniref:restriction endonuclease subunit S n=1 Tax=Bartonella sp. HY406 TaxID=2979331 RepID=UPI0021C8FAB3|nr:restriction endonuclease subunit S [Bartonella sp. HY406]UXN05100.1 restriction endonuclease subunit S [Bartonella sp. HY406]
MIVNLTKIVDIFLGYPLRESPDRLAIGKTAFIQLKNVDVDNGIDWPSVPLLTLPTNAEKYLLLDGDVIFSARGLHAYAYPIIEPPHLATCAPHFFIFRLKSKIISPQFLSWQINQKPAQNLINRTKTGAVTPTIRKDDLLNLPIKIPPLAQQNTILAFYKAANKEKQIYQGLMNMRQKQIDALAQTLAQT